MAGCPTPVISTIPGVYFLIILVLQLHMLRFCDVFREILVGSPVGADQLVVPVADTDFRHGSLQDCWLPIVRVYYRIIVVIKQQMVVIRYTCKILVFTQGKGPAR